MRSCALLIAVAACSGEPPPAGPRAPTSIPIDAGVRAVPDAAPAIDAAPPIDEAHARVILADRFRAAGLRVVYDVVVSGNGFELTADGWSPEKQLGFEYLDPADGDDVTWREGSWIGRDGRVLLVTPGTAEHVAAEADRFLAAALAVDAGV